MTRAEQEAFEKFMSSLFGHGCAYSLAPSKLSEYKTVFLAGYRAGFEAQHYEVDDGSRTD